MEQPWFKQYAKHVSRTLQYPNAPVYAFLEKTAAAHPEYIAMTFNDADTTYAELARKVNRFAAVLSGRGVKKETAWL